MSVLTDPAWLRARIDAGASTAEIASEARSRPGAVRQALRRYGIPLPREARNASIDLEAVFTQYRRGVPVTSIARHFGVSFSWVADRVIGHNIARDVPVRRPRASPHPELDDPDWLRQQVADGVGVVRIGRRVGASASAVKAAFERQEIDLPSDADRLEQVVWPSDPQLRYQSAVVLEAQARLALARAAQMRSSAVGELATHGFTVEAIADRLEVSLSVVERLLTT